MVRVRHVFVALAMVTLPACQSLRENQSQWHRAHDVPAGSTVSLARVIDIPAGRANVFIQGGKVQSYHATDLYSPYCELVLRGDLNRARTVQPDTFEIYRSVQEVNPIYGAQTSGVADVLGSGESRQMYQTTMYLQSKRQPQVYQLVCGHWVYASSDDYLTVAQIRSVLGKLFMLNLAGR